MSTSDLTKISLGTNIVYDHLCENTKRFVVEQGGTRCVSGLTLVRTPKGDVPIRDIQVDDYVCTPKGDRRVVNRFQYKNRQVARLSFGDKSIICTYNHRLLYNSWFVEVSDLHSIYLRGDIIDFYGDELIRLTNFETIDDDGNALLSDVYDIEVEGEHCYILSETGIVSHNSGKTYNIMMWLIFDYCQKNTGKVITIARKTSPSIIGTVLRDFINILMEAELYSEKNHNKTRNEYRLNGNLIEFIAVDEPQKVRGRRRHVCFCNEANELSYEDFFQLNMRTEELFIIDFNPSDVFHWIYDELIPRKNSETGESEVAFFQTSYKDNPFLPESLIKEIEAMQYIDPDKWEVYGLGNRASLKDIVYTNWHRVDTIPKHAKHRGYGLDFGFSVDPTALVSVWEADGQYYIEEILYEVGLTATDTAKKLKELKVDGVIYADNANPASIEEIKRAGFRIIGEKKLHIKEGIDRLKGVTLNILSSSKNLLKEIQMYKWKIDRNGNNMGEPVGRNDHGLDALRYWGVGNIKRRNYGKYRIK